MAKRVLKCIFFFLLSASAAMAQTSGTIVGNIHDSSGAQIAGATITVTNIERGTSQTAVSGSDGNYVVPFLPAGTYRVSSNPAYRYGSAGRGILRGPQTVNFDLSAGKNFAIKERATIQLRVDAFDALNHPPMGIPNQTINVNAPSQSSTKITTTTGDNRDLQGSLKISF